MNLLYNFIKLSFRSSEWQKKITLFKKSEISLLCPEKPKSSPNPGPDKPSAHRLTLFLYAQF
jgi:hypothetical protein